MAEKTYNTGRVVGWSTYEEFLKETGADPNIITNYIYQTLVTYGVTRIVTLSADRKQWKQHSNDNTTFYTTTVRVPGASWGAVPIVGIHYDTYIDTFYEGGEGSYKDAKPEEAYDKEALEKAVGNIFTCYVSDANGKRVQSSVAADGYLTFAAYPDILDFLEEMQAYDESFGGLQLIVRGLSMKDLDVTTLYYGPQGLLFAGNGLVEGCIHKTVDMSGLALAATGYLWLDIGSNSSGMQTGTDFRSMIDPFGTVLVTSTGYVDVDWVNGVGSYAGNGVYGLTKSELENDFLGAGKPFTIYSTRYNVIPSQQKDDYVYLIYGSSTYKDYPSGADPLYIFPVRKKDGRIAVGDYSDAGIRTKGKFKKRLTFTLVSNTGTKNAALYLKNKITAEYLGSYWGKDAPGEAACGYEGQNYLTFSKVTAEEEDAALVDAVFHDEGRQSWFKVPNNKFQKGNLIVIWHRADPKQNGVYFCTASEDYDATSTNPHKYSILNRRGAYIPTSTPEWVNQNGWWYADGRSFRDDVALAAAEITDGVLTVQGNRVYPNELVLSRDIDEIKPANYSWSITVALATIKNNQPFLIRQVGSCRTVITVDGTVTDQSTTYSSLIRVGLGNLTSALEETRTYTYKDGNTTSTDTFTAESEVSPGCIIQVKHNQDNVYGKGKDYCYTVLSKDNNYVRLASTEVFTADPDLFSVTEIAGKYNAAVPRYHQYDAEIPASWQYPMRTALAHITARQFFAEFGFDIADYVDPSFQNLSLGKFFQECTIRTTLTEPPSKSTLSPTTLSETYKFYSKSDLNYTPGSVFPQPTSQNPISASVSIEAKTSGDFFSTAYYTAKNAKGDAININDPNKPIWATVARSRFGEETTSLSLVDREGTFLEFGGGLGTIEVDKITWLDLLVGLGSGQALDMLHGMVIRRMKSDCNFIITADDTRLYISTTEPTPGADETIPDGSIGIGW